MVDKIVKAKQPDKPKPARQDSSAQADKPRQTEKSRLAPRASEKAHDKPKQPNAIARFYRESIGELRKVAWPTLHDTRRLTIIVLIVMFLMSAVLGLLDFLFSEAIRLLIS